jgi:2-hydroxy-6-oxonona-2,4-dienedioate hydrolase
MKTIFTRIPIYAALSLLTLTSTALGQAVAPISPISKEVEIYGQTIHFQEAGSGPNVILLHGLGGDTTHWALTIPALASKYHVYVLDQIGFGRSDKPIMNYRPATLVEFLHAFCKKLGIEKATVVGNSL